ncbi:MAG TPA: ABC transporter substrate-binding protein [Polyangiaceae bacterium]|nr:ABC transporter substrate-binding protein [Polyangiaceae bacterium]
MQRRAAISALAGLALASSMSSSCRSERAGARRSARKIELVVKHQPLGESDAFRRILRAFEIDHPDVTVVAEALPSSSDVAHQFFLTALEGQARDFDVFVVDIAWVAEFARAGWLLDLSPFVAPASVRRDFLAALGDAVIFEGKTFAVPWYVDTGVLYYRTDLVARPPSTYEELLQTAREAQRAHRQLSGFVWQGRQYEGLVCNVYEAIWGHGGQTMQGDRLLLQTEPARAALHYLQSLLATGISPPSVTSAAEEETRRAFQGGRAVFMRNWPYAFAETERQGSSLRGKVGLAPLPTLTGEPGHGVLGGYQLAVNAFVDRDKRDRAVALLRHLTSLEASVDLAVAYGRSPARRDAYDHPRLMSDAPLVAALRPAFERARPRPVTPYYMMLSDVLQGEFSAAITGVRAAEEALARAQSLVDHLMDAR